MSPLLTGSCGRAHRTKLGHVGAFVTLAVLGALTASCRDATGPGFRVSVTLSSFQGPMYSANSAGRQLLTCDVGLQAHPTGSGWASWSDATFAFFAPDDSTTPLATQALAAGTVRYSWGSDSISKAPESAHWRLTATVPFTLKATFRYQVAHGAGDSTAVKVACLPNTRPSGPPPTITTLTNLSPPGLEPGDTLKLAYAVSSPLGLWESLVRVTGPCDTTLMFPEQIQFSVSRTVSLVVPAGCALAIPVSVTAAALDTRLQATAQTLTLPALVDHTPPVLTATVRTPYFSWAPVATFSGYLFTGDAIELNVTAADNHSLHWIYREVQPADSRDSILTSGPAAYLGLAIPAQAAWVGPIQLRIYASDQSGNVGDTIASVAGGIQVFPTVGPAPTVSSIEGDITDVAFDQKRGVIYLLQSNSHRIAVFSAAGLTVLRTIPLTDYAPAIDLSPSGDSIITVLMNSHALGVVDLTQPSPALVAVPLAGLDSSYRLLDVRVAATGQALLAAQHVVLGGDTRLYTYVLASAALRLRLDAPALGTNSTGLLERSADGTVIVVNGGAGAFVRYDAATDAFGPGQTARIQASRPSVDATGAHVAVSGDVYNASLQFMLTVRPALSLEGPAAISPDGQTHYMVIEPAYTQLGIVRSRVSDGSIIDHIPSSLLITAMRVSPDGSALAVVESYNIGPARIALVNLPQLR